MTIVGWLADSAVTLLGIGLVAVLLMAALAPLEALGWWAGWWGREAYTPVRNRPPQTQGNDAATERPEHFVVYLSGLGTASKEWRFPEEAAFADRLQQWLGRAVVIDDVFAYAVTIRDLGEARLSRRLWEMVKTARLTNPDTMLGWLVMARNAFRIAVSVDHRYGPFFNLSNAETIREALVAHGYELGSGQRVTLIGYSGGGQMVVAATTFLTQLLNAPVRVISIGGSISSDPGLLWAEHTTHLCGDDDPIDKISDAVFAGRWPLLRKSEYNTAIAKGCLTFISLGPIGHTGTRGYYGSDPLPDGTPRLEYTVALVADLITAESPKRPAQPTSDQLGG